MENTENVQDPIVNTDISINNTENVNYSVTQQHDDTGVRLLQTLRQAHSSLGEITTYRRNYVYARFIVHFR